MIDLRSDTVTKPTPAMRAAMANAEVGDDVYGEDKTVIALEETAASLLGKEAALFVTSGTQGNQVAVLTHTRPSQEVIVESQAHIYFYEVGAMAALAGVQVRTVAGIRGQMHPDHVKHAIRDDDIHFPQTSLICLENTHNRAGGAVLPLAYMDEIQAIARDKKIALHLDGARLFHAAVATGQPIVEFARRADSVQVCLSKGLSAPIGSILAGSRDFIYRARKWRKALGGGMRQVGVLAAPGLIALTQMVDRLQDDHDRAKRLASALSQMPGMSMNPDHVETNIVLADITKLRCSPEEFLHDLANVGVLASNFGDGLIRFVTHLGIEDDDIEQAIMAIHQVVQAHKQFA